MNLKCKIEPIDDGQFLATVQGSNNEGKKHGNLGKVCNSLPEAVAYVHKQIDECVDKLGEKTENLPFGCEEDVPAKEDKRKTKKKK